MWWHCRSQHSNWIELLRRNLLGAEVLSVTNEGCSTRLRCRGWGETHRGLCIESRGRALEIANPPLVDRPAWTRIVD